MEIKIKNLSLRYGETEALENINLDIPSKFFLGITGPNGGGKTSLIRTIIGLEKPHKGKILKRKGLRIGYVPQHAKFNTEFPISVREVISMGLIKRKKGMFSLFHKSNEYSMGEILEELNLKEVSNRQIGQLSGGQLQRVLMARALFTDPDILILDEPTSSLDLETQKDIFKRLKELSKIKSVILVSHEKKMLKKYADKIVCIDKNLYSDMTIRITA